MASSLSTDAPSLAQLHYRNFLYRTTARHWHALWCRWLPDGSLKERFHAERAFAPTPSGDGVDMSVAYHFADERGTVNTGPRCGPWRITEEEHSAPDGLLHPSSVEMTTLLLPAGGPAAWCMKQSLAGEHPCAVELFLHHGDNIRMSAGVIHSVDGELMQLSAIREDSRQPFPSSFWSDSADAGPSDGAGVASALLAAGITLEGIKGSGHAIRGNLEQRHLSEVAWGSTRVATAGAGDVVMLCPDSIAIVAPKTRTPGEPFSSAAVWWPMSVDKDDSDTAGGARTVYTIEAHWDANGMIADVVYVVFRT